MLMIAARCGSGLWHLRAGVVGLNGKGGGMKTVKQLLQGKSKPLCTISPDAHVFDALKLMADRDIGALLVVEDDKLVGILSERDYARKMILHGKSSLDTPVRQIMTERVICV